MIERIVAVSVMALTGGGEAEKKASTRLIARESR
jgi:hypothetical protein